MMDRGMSNELRTVYKLAPRGSFSGCRGLRSAYALEESERLCVTTSLSTRGCPVSCMWLSKGVSRWSAPSAYVVLCLRSGRYPLKDTAQCMLICFTVHAAQVHASQHHVPNSSSRCVSSCHCQHILRAPGALSYHTIIYRIIAHHRTGAFSSHPRCSQHEPSVSPP